MVGDGPSLLHLALCPLEEGAILGIDAIVKDSAILRELNGMHCSFQSLSDEFIKSLQEAEDQE